MSDPIDTSELMEFLEDQVGDSLRTVGYFDGENPHLLYMRQDQQDKLSQDDIQTIINEWTAGSLSKSYLEDLYKSDRLDYIVQKFEDGIAIVFFFGEQGVFVGVDSDIDILPSHFVNECLNKVGRPNMSER